MEGIEGELSGQFGSARSRRLATSLKAEQQGGYTELTLPDLGRYDVAVLQSEPHPKDEPVVGARFKLFLGFQTCKRAGTTREENHEG